MGDDNSFLNFSAAPIPTAQPKQKSQKSSKTTSTPRKKVSPSSTVYGEELFKAAWKPTKSIVVCFWPFTKNYIRISKDEYAGKFAIQYNASSGGGLLLYHFTKNPFDFGVEGEIDSDLIREMEITIPIDDDIRIYGPYDDANQIKLKLINILRYEVLMEKKKSLADIREAEKLALAEKERLENEQDKLTEQLAEAGILSSIYPDFSETENASKASEEKKDLVEQKIEETKDEGAKFVKDRSGSIIKLTPIVY